MRKFLYCLFGSLLGSVLPLEAENLRQPSLPALGMGNSGVVLSSSLNPALLPLSTGKSIDLSYLNRYLVKELGTLSLGFDYAGKRMSTGLRITSFGYDEYRETLFRLALGKQLGNHWSLGIGIQYAMVHSVLWEHTPSRLSTDVGVIYKPVDKLWIGLSITDLPSVLINQQNVDLDSFKSYSVQLGFRYEVINHTLITVYTGMREQHRLTGGLGLEYEVLNCFYLRGGLQVAPLLPTFGFGCLWRSFQIDAATVYHPVLGVSLAAGLRFTF